MSESSTVAIADGCVVTMHYTLRDASGTLIDESDRDQPLAYLHGGGNIVPGLEVALVGKVAGDKFDVQVAPEDGYGPRTSPGPQAVRRSDFPDDAPLFPGMGFAVEGPRGEEIMLFVTEVHDDKVYVDTDHPLAGVTLHFSIEIVGVRQASDEEIAHGHPHEGGVTFH